MLDTKLVDVCCSTTIKGKHALIIGYFAAKIKEVFRTVRHRVRILHQRIDLKADLEAL